MTISFDELQQLPVVEPQEEGLCTYTCTWTGDQTVATDAE